LREKTMEEIGRRSALALGLAATAAPALVSSRATVAQAYGPDEGKETSPGVREIELSQREAVIPGYKTVKMLDIVFQPGAQAPQETMENDVVCQITEGEMTIVLNGEELRVKKNDVYTCAKGMTDVSRNDGDTVAVMRAIVLMSA
jgi:quercetin dioxygenase-like cupin family protein